MNIGLTKDQDMLKEQPALIKLIQDYNLHDIIPADKLEEYVQLEKSQIIDAWCCGYNTPTPEVNAHIYYDDVFTTEYKAQQHEKNGLTV